MPQFDFKSRTLVEIYNNLLKISPWITVVLPAVVVIAVCFFNLALIKLVIPATLVFLSVLLAFSVVR